jgi:hypothetical protein
MIGRVWRAYRIEAAKALRRKFTLAGPLILVVAVAALPLAREIARDGVGDYGFVAYATPLALDLLGLLLLLSYCATLVASELSGGTVCYMLVRPLKRHEFMAAKLLFAVSYAALLEATVIVASWAMTAALGDLTGVTFGGEVVHTNLEMISAYAIGALLALAPLCAAAAFAVMVSSLTRSTGAAVGCTVGLWLLVDLAKYPLRIAPFLFSSYLEAPWQVFADQCDGLTRPWFPEALYGLASSMVAFAVFSVVSIAVFRVRNLRS